MRWLTSLLLALCATTLAHGVTYTATNDAGLVACNANLRVGDTCEVSAGVYTQSILPSASGASYVCASKNCVIRPVSGNALDLRERSTTTIDGFTFERNAIVWGNGSTGNAVKNITVQANGLPHSELQAGCGTDNTLDGFTINSPGEQTLNALTLGWASGGCSTTVHDQRAIVKNGIVRGGRNNSINYCDNCIIDNLLVTGAWNHTLSVGDNGNSRCNALTIRNSKFLASTSFRESMPDVRDVNGLTLLNNLFTGYGLDLPGHNSPANVTGTVKVHNNVFVNYGTGSGEFSVWLVGNAAIWDIDYNAYIPGPSASTPSWKRDAASYYTLATWQALGFDLHSIVIGNGSFVYGAAAPLWGMPTECAISPGSFDTVAAWGEGVAVGDYIEYDWDGTARQITGLSAGSGGNCATRVVFTPALAASPTAHRWMLDWKQSNGTGKSFVPQTGAAIIDAGNPVLCGHVVAGTRCDIGPVESGSAGCPACPACPTFRYTLTCGPTGCIMTPAP